MDNCEFELITELNELTGSSLLVSELVLSKFKKYDERFDPKKKIRFGDLNKPVLTGSWE